MSDLRSHTDPLNGDANANICSANQWWTMLTALTHRHIRTTGSLSRGKLVLMVVFLFGSLRLASHYYYINYSITLIIISY